MTGRRDPNDTAPVLAPHYPIETARLLLRPFVPEDLDALYAIESRADVMRYLYGEPRTREETKALLTHWRELAAIEKEGDRLTLATERRDTGAVIGYVTLRWLSAEHMGGEIGWVLHPEHQGRGFAHEAAMAIFRLGFEELGLHRIIGRCDTRNDASARLMERLGMRREAHFLENEFFKGEWGSEYVYALLASEWTQ